MTYSEATPVIHNMNATCLPLHLHRVLQHLPVEHVDAAVQTWHLF
jgi:hypothetical protein